MVWYQTESPGDDDGIERCPRRPRPERERETASARASKGSDVVASRGPWTALAARGRGPAASSEGFRRKPKETQARSRPLSSEVRATPTPTARTRAARRRDANNNAATPARAVSRHNNINNTPKRDGRRARHNHNHNQTRRARRATQHQHHRHTPCAPPRRANNNRAILRGACIRAPTRAWSGSYSTLYCITLHYITCLRLGLATSHYITMTCLRLVWFVLKRQSGSIEPSHSRNWSDASSQYLKS